MSFHPMLLRQLERSGWSPESPPPSHDEWNKLLQRISIAYTEADQERYLLGRSLDIASRETEEICLRLTEAQHIAGLGDWYFDLQNNTGQCSDGCIHICDISCTSLTPSYSSFLECFHNDDREKLIQAVNNALVTLESFEMELRIATEISDGRWVHLNVQPIPEQEGPASRIRGTAMDISERKRSEHRMELTQFVMDNASVNVTLLDRHAHICYVNTTACETLGYTNHELLKMRIPDINPLFPDEMWEKHWQTLTQHKTLSIETLHQRKNGEIFPVEVTANYMEFGDEAYIVAFDRDISERKGLEEQLLQSQKMEAIGTLVGGIAHDFNNMLAGVLGNTYLAKMNAADTPSLLRNIEAIEKLSNKSADMIRQMLTFARKDHVKMHPLSANTFLKEAVEFAKTAIPENIECRYDTHPENLNIIGDPTQLQQVIMNLMNNAKDALSDINNGEISCSLKPYIADMAFRSKYPDYKGEKLARITVSDNGNGIRNDLLESIFDPFFTTKEVGKGTGLGLAMVYGAVKNHRGEIEVESLQGQGTTFSIYLPLASADIASKEAQTSQPDLARGNGELVLVADDELQVREVVKAVLEKLGYMAITAEDGISAADLHKKHAHEISLVILDVVMPKMGGIDAANLIRKSNPDVPIIFATGYDRETALEAQQDIANNLILNKPFKVENLSQAIRQLLVA